MISKLKLIWGRSFNYFLVILGVEGGNCRIGVYLSIINAIGPEIVYYGVFDFCFKS